MEDFWTTFVNRYSTTVVTSVRRILGNDHEAADVVQEVFFEAFRLIDRLNVQNWTAFLRTLATRRAIDHLRSRNNTRRGEVAVEEISLFAGSFPQPHKLVEAAELADRLRKALAVLPARQAEVFALRYFDEMKYEEIASELQMTVNAVGLALNKARTRLQAIFEDESI